MASSVVTRMKRAACGAAAAAIIAASALPVSAYAAVDFSKHTVDTVSPAGTTINLFDYWMTKQTDPDNSGAVGKYQPNGGINTDHPFKFVFGNDASTGIINDWTGAGRGPRRNIVEDLLVNNMPQLTQANGGQSLAYLFDPNNTESSFRAAYTGVGNLLQVDDEGYFYYNSQENFASYDAASNKFNVYDAPAVITHDEKNSIPDGQFFPFNTAKEVFEDEAGKDGKLVLNRSITDTNAALNHWFGLTMSTRFVQPKDGYVDDDSSVPMTYEFSGDDDVWIFIDGVLVGDLGGIHDANRIKIDFSTGEVVTYRDLTGTQEGTVGGTIDKSTTIAQAFKDAGVNSNLDGSIFADGTYHTLKFFYLERGNYASNMNLKFNLVTVPESQIVKVDQMGNPIEGVTFELWGQYNKGTEDKPEWVRGKHQLAEGTTDENGKLTLVDPITEEPFSFDVLYSDGNRLSEDGKPYTRFELEEMNPPEGYRSSGTIQLEYHPSGSSDFGGHVTMVEDDIWKTGAYASSGVLVSAPSDIYAYDSQKPDGKGEDKIDQDQGTLFAVILKYVGDGEQGLANPDNWKAVSGDSLNGWKLESASSVADVAAAAKGGAGHAFIPSSSGAHEVMIDELPGDLDNYYNYIKDSNADFNDTKYTVAYYHTTAETLAGATGDNTTRLYIDSDKTTESFRRQFSVNLQVPNIKNFLYVQKTDAEWKPITDEDEALSATFRLYEENQVDTSGSEPTLKEGAQPYDTVHTQKDLRVDGRHVMDSGAQFPSKGKVLKKGTYYLAEDAAPDGYRKRTQLTKVVVTNSGVFADAGAKGDDVRVRTGVGHLVKTMTRFASSEQIDNTLQDITAQLMVSDNAPVYDQQGGWQVDWELAKPEQKLNLSYGASNALLQYGLTGHKGEEDRDTFEDVTIMADSGWSSLAIKQNYGIADGTPSNANKQQLGDDVYLNRLFSESTTVQIANHAEGALKISKAVENAAENDSTEFTVEVSLWHKADGSDAKKPISGTYSLSVTDANGVVQDRPDTITFDKEGKATVTLQNGWSAIIGGADSRLCADKGYGYTVKEIKIPDNFVQKNDSPSNSEGDIKRSVANNVAESNVVTVTNVYVLGFGIHKVDAADKKKLEGVEFVLCDDLGGSDGTADGTYDPASDFQSALYSDQAQNQPVTWPVLTDGEGNLAVYGLQIGKSYWVIETKALGGYQLIKPVRFTVQQDGKLKFDHTSEPVKQENGIATITIENSKVPNLPQTGGPGNVPLYAAGVALIAGAAFALERNRTVRKFN